MRCASCFRLRETSRRSASWRGGGSGIGAPCNKRNSLKRGVDGGSSGGIVTGGMAQSRRLEIAGRLGIAA